MTFVFLDRLLALDAERARFVKCCSLSEDFYMEHFPGFPVFPGALVIETFSQAATLLLAARSEFREWPLLRGVERARFFQMLRPGDRLEIEVRRLEDGAVDAMATLGEKRVASATLRFEFAKPEPDDAANVFAANLGMARLFLGMLSGSEQ